jgi:hypothetical protein
LENATTVESAAGEFVYLHDPTLPATAAINQDVARVNAFYLVNSIHDLTYRYGFTEATFNFQKTNIAEGGLANDHVLISVQDPSGRNNAKFASEHAVFSGCFGIDMRLVQLLLMVKVVPCACSSSILPIPLETVLSKMTLSFMK